MHLAAPVEKHHIYLVINTPPVFSVNKLSCGSCEDAHTPTGTQQPGSLVAGLHIFSIYLETSSTLT